jgi:hypothetical protein
MDTVYKLTSQDITTHKGFQWAVGEWVEASGEGELCGPGWLHCYFDPLVALMHNPMHANITNPRLWRCEAAGEMMDDCGLKCGYARMRLVEEMPVEAVTTHHRVRYAILCARAVLAPGAIPAWDAWADAYMARDTSAALAAAACAAESAEARSAVDAVCAAESAACVAESAAKAAEWSAARAAAAAEWSAANAAARAAAAAAARAAEEAASRGTAIDFPELARRAVKEG